MLKFCLDLADMPNDEMDVCIHGLRGFPGMGANYADACASC
jgi:hypothetical protein